MAKTDTDRIVDWVGEQLGTVRNWRLVILSGLGGLLMLALLVILAGVYLSGSATLDDIGLPLVFAVVLTPILVGGGIYGAVQLRALRTHELLLALSASPPRIERVEELQDGIWRGVRFTVPSGQQYAFWAPNPEWAQWVIGHYARAGAARQP